MKRFIGTLDETIEREISGKSSTWYTKERRKVDKKEAEVSDSIPFAIINSLDPDTCLSAA